ncbi:MAG: MarR family winged helix-turn-helix transcriptional regulator [Muribaculaceae bacterium]|nr:MarR family winged helix-turn-helix transcriptional regulator [Muribaculaceae bacterium]
MTNVSEYPMPNLGCLIGAVYQQQLSGLASALAERGLDIIPSEYLVLRSLYGCDGMQQCDVAALLGKDKAGVSRCVSAMERKGLVGVQTVSHKCRRVWLTEKGRELEYVLLKVAEERHKALNDLVSAEDMKTFVKVLKQILQSK